MAGLRTWQKAGYARYLLTGGENFLAVATPGAGKTFFALFIARQLLDQGTVRRLEIVVPSDHLKVQWAAAAHEMGMHLEAQASNGNGNGPLEDRRDYIGCVVTYSQVAAEPSVHRRACLRRQTLVILDEVHHAGDDKTWGRAIRHAFEVAERRLSLSGTPFRTDRTEIPFVRYEMIDGQRYALPDCTYPYGKAIRDGVCRPLEFRFYDAHMRHSGAKLGRDMITLSGEIGRAEKSAAISAALDPDGPWARGLLQRAAECLKDLRTEVPDAAGLVLATDAGDAKRYAQILKEMTGEQPAVVLSENGRAAKEAIENFGRSTASWIVAVRMVAEGVDIPRVSVECYLTRTRTLMFFIQAIGRAVRRRAGDQHAAVVFLPAIDVFREIAGRIEEEIQQAIAIMAEEEQTGGAGFFAPAEQTAFDLPDLERQILEASDPIIHELYFRGINYQPPEHESTLALMRELALPTHHLGGVMELIRRRTAEQERQHGVHVPAPAAPHAWEENPRHRAKHQIRSRLNSMANQICYALLPRGCTEADRRRKSAEVNRQLNQAMGIDQRDQASVAQLSHGLTFAENWLDRLRKGHGAG